MSRTQLGRPAIGLARFYMDCNWWTHPRFIDCTPTDLHIATVLISYCTKNSTDGLIPIGKRSTYGRLGVTLGIESKYLKGSLPRLEACGFLTKNEEEIAIVGWARHNPTRDEVDEYTEERSTAGTKGNHARWHTGKGVVSDDCEWCQEEANSESLERSLSDSQERSLNHRMAWHGMGWDESDGNASDVIKQGLKAVPVDNSSDGQASA